MSRLPGSRSGGGAGEGVASRPDGTVADRDGNVVGESDGTMSRLPGSRSGGGESAFTRGDGAILDGDGNVIGWAPGTGPNSSGSGTSASRFSAPDLGELPEFDLSLDSLLKALDDPSRWDMGVLQRVAVKLKSSPDNRQAYEAIFGDLDAFENFAFHCMDDGRVDDSEMAYARALFIRLGSDK